MKKTLKKSLKKLLVGALVAGSIVGSAGLQADAATKAITASGTVNGINFLKAKPVAYLYTYNSNGSFIAKYALSSSFQFGNKYKLTLGRTCLDDKKVAKVCLQLKSDNGTKYSSKVNLRSGAYTITMNGSGSPTLK